MTDPIFAGSFRKAAAALGAGVAALGAVVLLGGWLFEISILKSLQPGGITIKANTSVGLVLAGCAVWSLAIERGRTLRTIGTGCAVLVGLIGLITVAEYAFGQDLGIDELLFDDPATTEAPYAGRMAPVTAVNFWLLAIALVLALTGSALRYGLADALLLIVLLSSYVACVGHLYGAQSMYTVPPYSSIAWPTAAALLLLGAAALMMQPARGLMRLVLSEQAGGAMARRLLPWAVIVPLVLGWLRLEGERHGYYDTTFGVALLVVVLMAGLAGVILWNVKAIDGVDGERKRLDVLARLNETRERLAAIVDSSDDAIIGTTLDGIVTSWNRGAERLFGFAAEEIVGRSISLLIPADRAGERWMIGERLAWGEGLHQYETVRCHKDGRRIDVTLTISPIHSASGEVVAASAVTHDISERKKVEMMFRGLLETAPDAMVITDQEGCIVMVNAETERLFQYSREEMIGQTVEMLMPVRHRSAHARNRAQYSIAMRQRPMGAGRELQGLRKDGSEFPIEIGLSPLETADGVLISSTIRDVSEAKQREAKLVAARTEADIANRAKSDFVSRMSHELRTPLNAVIGYAQMLELDRQGTLTEMQKDYCRNILTSSNHLLGLVNEVLDLAQIEAGKLHLSLERINVATALAEIEKMMSPIAARAGVKLTVVHASRVPDIQADDLRLRQVLVNLVSNAIKYNRAGGAVTVSARAAGGDRVRLHVTDSGFGIAEELQARLFDPFSRLGAEHANIEGIGLGLAISRRLIEAMRGTVGFKSARGKGSTFWIELPVDAAAPVQWAGRIDATIKAAAPFATAGDYSILYVDDNLANLRLMEQIISTLRDVALLVARTPQLGLDLAVAHRPDVIVLDVNLPGMSGYELVARLKALPETCHIPVLALSAAASAHSPQRDAAAGFFRYLTKPIDVKAFLCAVDQALMAPRVLRAGNGG